MSGGVFGVFWVTLGFLRCVDDVGDFFSCSFSIFCQLAILFFHLVASKPSLSSSIPVFSVAVGCFLSFSLSFSRRFCFVFSCGDVPALLLFFLPSEKKRWYKKTPQHQQRKILHFSWIMGYHHGVVFFHHP